MAGKQQEEMARYRKLLMRALVELRLAHDLAVAQGVPAKRRARLTQVRQSLRGELKDIIAEKAIRDREQKAS